MVKLWKEEVAANFPSQPTAKSGQKNKIIMADGAGTVERWKRSGIGQPSKLFSSCKARLPHTFPATTNSLLADLPPFPKNDRCWCSDTGLPRCILLHPSPARGWPAWWVKPKILRIPHNITAMLGRVSAACYGGCHAWLLEGIFSFSLNAWHPQTINRRLGRNRWNRLLTLPVMKMISQLTLLIYSILWEDEMSTSEASLQIVSKRASSLAFRLIYGELWQACKLWDFPFMFTFVHFSLAVSVDRQISAAT